MKNIGSNFVALYWYFQSKYTTSQIKMLNWIKNLNCRLLNRFRGQNKELQTIVKLIYMSSLPYKIVFQNMQCNFFFFFQALLKSFFF